MTHRNSLDCTKARFIASVLLCISCFSFVGSRFLLGSSVISRGVAYDSVVCPSVPLRSITSKRNVIDTYNMMEIFIVTLVTEKSKVT